MKMDYFIAMEELFMLNYLLLQYIQYFFRKGATSLQYSLRNTTRSFFHSGVSHTLAQLRNEY